MIFDIIGFPPTLLFLNSPIGRSHIRYGYQLFSIKIGSPQLNSWSNVCSLPTAGHLLKDTHYYSLLIGVQVLLSLEPVSRVITMMEIHYLNLVILTVTFFASLIESSSGNYLRSAPQQCPIDNGNLIGIKLFVRNSQTCFNACEVKDGCRYFR